MNYIALTVLNLTRAELYRMNPGIFFDLVALKNESLKQAGKQDE